LTVDNLDIEDKVRVGGDSWLGGSTIGGGSWAANISLLTNGKVDDCILPALDHSHFTNSEGNWLSSWDRGIEDLTISSEGSGVLNLSSLT